MGVPAFYRWLSLKYPKIVDDVLEERVKIIENSSSPSIRIPFDHTRPNPSGLECDNFYVDMNGIIHPCSHPENGPQPKSEIEMFENICMYIDRLVRVVRPRNLLFLAIDGVAPRAKMNQQRSRRFRTAQEMRERENMIKKLKVSMKKDGYDIDQEDSMKRWDPNVITPGTKFMLTLSSYVRFYIRKRLATNESWKKIRVLFSDASIPGEGEHKIMSHIRLQRSASITNPTYDSNGKNANIVHVLHGLDADLIMLALATHEAHFYILREEVTFGRRNTQDNERRKESSGFTDKQRRLDEEVGSLAMSLPENNGKPLQRLSVPILREYLRYEFQSVLNQLPFAKDFERLVDDVVFLCFFVGNDFLPHLPCLDIRDGALDFLFNIYKRLLPGLGGYLTDHGGEVHLGRVDVLLSEVGAVEDYVFAMCHENDQKDKKKRKIQKLKSNSLLTSNNETFPSPDIGRKRFTHMMGVDGNIMGRAQRVLTKSFQCKDMSNGNIIGNITSRQCFPRDKKSSESMGNRRHWELDDRDKLKNKINFTNDTIDRKSFMSKVVTKNALALHELKFTLGTKENNIEIRDKKISSGDMEFSDPDSPFYVGSSSNYYYFGREKNSVKKEKTIEEKDNGNLERKISKNSSLKQVNTHRNSTTFLPRNGEEIVGTFEVNNDGPKAITEMGGVANFDEKIKEPDADDCEDVNKLFETRLRETEREKLQFYADSFVDKIRLHESGWKDRYYRDKCKAKDVAEHGGKEHMFRSYIMGLCWVMKYYYDGCPSWMWYYPFHYAPFASDLRNIVRFDRDCKSFELGKPFQSVQQLMAVLPNDSSHAVPEAAKWLMSDQKSPISEFYPKNISYDPNGKAMPWLWVVLLPFIDENRLLSALEGTISKWSDIDHLCNARGLDDGYLYIHVSHPLASAILPVLESPDQTKKLTIDNYVDMLSGGFPGFVRSPQSNEIYPIDEASTVNSPLTSSNTFSMVCSSIFKDPIHPNAALCAAFSEPPKKVHRSVILAGALPPKPVLVDEDLIIKRPILNGGGTSIANLGTHSQINVYGSMNINAYRCQLAQSIDGRYNNNQVGTQLRGGLEPTQKCIRRNDRHIGKALSVSFSAKKYSNHFLQSTVTSVFQQPKRGVMGRQYDYSYDLKSGIHKQGQLQYSQQKLFEKIQFQFPPLPTYQTQKIPSVRTFSHSQTQRESYLKSNKCSYPSKTFPSQYENLNNKGTFSFQQHSTNREKHSHYIKHNNHAQSYEGKVFLQRYDEPRSHDQWLKRKDFSGVNPDVMNSLRSQLARTLQQNRHGSSNRMER